MNEVARNGSVKTQMPDITGVPMAFWYPKLRISAVCRSEADCQDLVKWFDNEPNFCPYQPVLIILPNGVMKQVAGLGFATAAEMRDCCLELWGIYTSGEGEKRFNVDEMREEAGYVRREDVATAVAYAFADRIARHKASPITDPWKQFRYPNPTHKVKFGQMPSNEGWKGK